MATDGDKIAAQHVEDFEMAKVPHDDLEDLPESLRHLNPQELSKMGKWITLKMDLVIMPALTILYILFESLYASSLNSH